MFQFIEKMDLDSVYRRLSDICILLNRLISDIKEHGDQLQLGGVDIVAIIAGASSGRFGTI